MRQPRSSRSVLAVAIAVAIGTVGFGCAANSSAPVPTYTPIRSGTPAPTATPTDPVLRPGGSALANQEYFTFVNSRFFATRGMSDGRSIVDNLVAAGFAKNDMEVTPDQTSIGVTADSIIVSVRIKTSCLIGQFAASGYTDTLAPVLGTGGCLVGTTRAIDW
jgi:hypothetical protein